MLYQGICYIYSYNGVDGKKMKVFYISIHLCFECFQKSSLSFSHKTVYQTVARPRNNRIGKEKKSGQVFNAW